MASRSSAGIGVGITITLLGVVCLTLFITTIVFLSKYNATNRDLIQTNQQVAEYVRQDEMQNDAITRIRETAKRNNKSAIGYLSDSLRTAMQRTTGSPNETVEGLERRMQQIPGASGSNLVAVISDRDRQISDLNTRLEQADRDRQTALANQQNEANRVRQLQETHQQTIAAMNSDIERYKGEVDRYREEVSESRRFMDQRVESTRETAASSEAALNERVRNLEGENLQLKDQLARLRGEKRQDILTGLPEASLVDANVIAIDSSSNAVTIDRGRRDKMVLGMRFAVYTDQTAIRPNAAGEYPPGKAVVEVINVGETSSTARVVSETRGNPIVRGDVLANAIYDPNKVYTFLVYGNFDANGDGMATPAEAEDVKARIVAWGGRVVDDLSGDVDFVVLGQRPQLPPRPDVGAPLPVLQEFMRLDAMATRYDDLFRQATSTSMPVLNENRLYTLIGGRPNAR
jgi:hypothetical protein